MNLDKDSPEENLELRFHIGRLVAGMRWTRNVLETGLEMAEAKGNFDDYDRSTWISAIAALAEDHPLRHEPKTKGEN
jgi:hypothetical protein